MTQRACWQCGDRAIPIGERPLVMGILNVTPDSFHDGGRHADFGRAVAHGLRMIADGADIVDVGGESTRPGATPTPVEEELRRVVPVVRELAARTDRPISVDTRKAAVARAALEAGACIVNDVTALAGDSDMEAAVREHRAGAVLMHMRGAPPTMQDAPRYTNVVAEVRDFLAGRLAALMDRGLARASLAVDPGIGFGKTLDHNLALLRNLGDLLEIGAPLVVGLSRKRFLGAITGRDAADRLAGSLSALALCVFRGAHVLRVHDVAESRDAALVAAALGGHDAVLD